MYGITRQLFVANSFKNLNTGFKCLLFSTNKNFNNEEHKNLFNKNTKIPIRSCSDNKHIINNVRVVPTWDFKILKQIKRNIEPYGQLMRIDKPIGEYFLFHPNL